MLHIIEERLDEVLRGTPEEVNDKAHDLLVPLRLTKEETEELWKDSELNFERGSVSWYTKLIMAEHEVFSRVLIKLFKIQQEVYTDDILRPELFNLVWYDTLCNLEGE
jgi:hypothetical protein